MLTGKDEWSNEKSAETEKQSIIETAGCKRINETIGQKHEPRQNA